MVCTDSDWSADRATSRLSFDCPSLTEFPDEISVGAGLVSASGAELSAVVVTKASLTLQSCGPSCDAARIN